MVYILYLIPSPQLGLMEVDTITGLILEMRKPKLRMGKFSPGGPAGGGGTRLSAAEPTCRHALGPVPGSDPTTDCIGLLQRVLARSE